MANAETQYRGVERASKRSIARNSDTPVKRGRLSLPKDEPLWKTKYEKPFSEFITITPQMASYALAHAAQNRLLSSPYLSDLVDAMSSGDFSVNGESIKFGKDGLLFDGRHRLTACVKANKPMDSLVVYGMDEGAVKSVDLNKPRSIGDMVAIGGGAYSTQTGAAARWLMVIKRKGILIKSRSVRLIHQTVCAHPELTTSVSRCYRAKGVSPSIISAIHYIGTVLLDKSDEANAFAAAFVDGIPTRSDKCPAIAYREHFINLRLTRMAVERTEMLFGAISAWNFVAGDKPFSRRHPISNTSIEGLDLDRI